MSNRPAYQNSGFVIEGRRRKTVIPAMDTWMIG